MYRLWHELGMLRNAWMFVCIASEVLRPLILCTGQMCTIFFAPRLPITQPVQRSVGLDLVCAGRIFLFVHQDLSGSTSTNRRHITITYFEVFINNGQGFSRVKEIGHRCSNMHGAAWILSQPSSKMVATWLFFTPPKARSVNWETHCPTHQTSYAVEIPAIIEKKQ